ncbi:MAG: hypothetical protein KC621_07000 [Myxococcales bacterium]|nr:hypothetical protein [Myxococcales bacterium]
MGAVAHQVERHEGLPRRAQMMDLLAFFALPASTGTAFATCVLVMWSMNGGGETAWAIWAGLMATFGIGSAALIAGSLADQR